MSVLIIIFGCDLCLYLYFVCVCVWGGGAKLVLLQGQVQKGNTKPALFQDFDDDSTERQQMEQVCYVSATDPDSRSHYLTSAWSARLCMDRVSYRPALQPDKKRFTTTDLLKNATYLALKITEGGCRPQARKTSQSSVLIRGTCTM